MLVFFSAAHILDVFCRFPSEVDLLYIYFAIENFYLIKFRLDKLQIMLMLSHK